ncbi:3-deoxy-manno-octulosonate cytidylyltransferase [Magnetospirillum sp. ME-1]|uniref:3-deoxy-manno-octulosonate cytidylyltransferase n=1 Tax=Magnetospirillum sp. ME-1 TaxID=1639348 RepID=UPI000A17D770|nr:3-deoxy-manno-octulosonate cytidylyltransferase [Magnetospirillum sp. ME-1]ARJ66534.1 3-deoxy-manno-octulosonate cytidylyltransferase [Magnetospirillum sp. ME-1]
MKVVAMIPARMGSSRFPGKPLAPILGRPMLEHVYRRTALCPELAETYVATCDEEIRSAVEGFGGKAIMTADTHERASDRIAEAAAGIDADIIVMVQGDEPMTHPGMISESLVPFRNEPGTECVNLMKRIDTEADFNNRDTIKVVVDLAGFALYMSREPIPTRERLRFGEFAAYKQVCIIPFTRDGLMRYTRLAPTPLEIAESIDMMRLIEHGHRVRMVETAHSTQAVDRPEELERVGEMLRGDPLLARYS